MHTCHAIIKKTPKGGVDSMESFLYFVWVPLLAPILVGIAISTYSDWLKRKNK